MPPKKTHYLTCERNWHRNTNNVNGNAVRSQCGHWVNHRWDIVGDNEIPTCKLCNKIRKTLKY